jgi:GDP-L-fucose synthase
MDHQSRIFVAGHRGMVGSAIVRALEAAGYRDILTRTRAELPLTDAAAVDRFFAEARPTHVFLAAAKVGGILANMRDGADFIRENLQIEVNVIDAAFRHGASKLLFLGSSCIYPRDAAQPMREDALLTGPLEATNLPYAVAKIAGVVMCDAYRRQYGFDAFTVMPSNVYGRGDNFHPEHSHVVAGMMRRFHEARRDGLQEMLVWGTGAPMRELIDADDLADACLFLMQRYTEGGLVNVGSGEEISIRDLARLMQRVVGYEGAIRFDPTRPDGTPRKIMDNSRLFALGWRPRRSIEAGIAQMYAWYRSEAEPRHGG